jgi:dolichol-phosphate mannosyltransferase
MRVSIVVPVYNEEDNINPLARELDALSSSISDLEVLFVDDGSTDGTWQKIKDCMADMKSVRGLRYRTNRGQSSATLIGLQKAGGDVLVTIDGDMQNNPEDIPKLVEQLTDCDVVCGYRANRKDTWARRYGSKLANRARNAFTKDGVRDTGCSLKAFRKECVSDLPPVRGVHRFMPAYFRMNGRKLKEMPADHRPRTLGTSKYTNLQRLPRTIFDLVGFIWYRSRYLPPLKNSEIELTD